jgi:hypothetical protein
MVFLCKVALGKECEEAVREDQTCCRGHHEFAEKPVIVGVCKRWPSIEELFLLR